MKVGSKMSVISCKSDECDSVDCFAIRRSCPKYIIILGHMSIYLTEKQTQRYTSHPKLLPSRIFIHIRFDCTYLYDCFYNSMNDARTYIDRLSVVRILLLIFYHLIIVHTYSKCISRSPEVQITYRVAQSGYSPNM